MIQVAQDYLSGEIDYRNMQKLRRDFCNPRLSMIIGALGDREIWDTNHPALKTKPNK